MLQDLKYAVRMLEKSRGFTIIAVIALALGIGANTAIFSMVYGILLQPLPYKDADRLYVANISIPDYRDLKESNRVFDEMAIWASNLYNLRNDRDAEQVLGAVVSPSFFTLLGQARVGRIFKPEEDREPLAVLSYDLWQSRFGGDRNVLGKSINLSGNIHTVVGVMPREFQFPDSRFKLWVTFGSAMGGTPQQAENRSLRIFRALAHLKPDVSQSQAQVEVNAIAERLRKEHPKTNEGVQIVFTPIYERIVGNVRSSLLILMGTVGLVLLIACANVANLMLARTSTREREIAIRAALGASRGRIARQLLTESVLLSSLGGVLGLLLAMWGIDLLPSLSPNEIPRLSTIGINIPVLAFTMGVSLLTGVIFGSMPALKASRINLHDAMKEGGKGLAGNRWGQRMRSALVVAEIALSLVVLIGAGLLVKSFVLMLETDAGFSDENLVTLHVVGLFHYKEPERRALLAREVLSRIAEIPGAQVVGGGSGIPPSTPQRGTRYEVEGRQTAEGESRSGYFIATSPDYFRALGTRLIQGRQFNDQDSKDAPKVVIVNQSLARVMFPNEDPVGKRLKLVNPEHSDEWRAIVGVVGDIKYAGLDSPSDEAVYTPFSQTPFLWIYVMVKSTDPPGLAASLRSAVSSVDPKLEASKIQTMRDLVSQSVAQPQFNMVLLGGFSILALLLAAIGLYGVMAYSVTERTREIGIRMALGAQSSDVLRMIMGQGIIITLIGIAVGLAGAYAVTRVMSSLLYEVSVTDSTTFLSISVLLTLISLLAGYIPARRATKVDPIVALRYE